MAHEQAMPTRWAPAVESAAPSIIPSSRIPNRWLFAGATAVWITLFIFPEPGLTIVALPLCVVAMLILPERPIAAAAIVLVASELVALDGRPFGEVELLLPTFAALTWLGASGRPLWVGTLAVAGFVLTSVQRPSEWLAALVSAAIVYGIAFCFGVLVQRRATAAARAVREAERAASLDLEALSERSAAAERRRVASALIGDLRAALDRIASLARHTRERQGPHEVPDAPTLSSIRRTADEILTKLHTELGAMMALPRPALPEAAPSGPAPAGDARGETAPSNDDAVAGRPSRRRTGLAKLGAATTAGSAAMLATTALLGGDVTHPSYLFLAALPVAIAAAGRSPLAAAAIAVCALTAATLASPPRPEALVPTGAALFALFWRYAKHVDIWRITWADGYAQLRDHWRGYVAIAATVAAATGLGAQHDRSSVAFVLLAAILATTGADAWHDRDRVTQAEEARAARLLARAATAQLAAVHVERRRLARELHDIVSHAVVGVSLQARAAAHPGIASAASNDAAPLETIADVASNASRELGDLAARLGDSPPPDIETLVARGRALGLTVATAVDSALAHEALAARIVRECLTNVARYAPGAAVEVEVRASGPPLTDGTGGAIEVSVRNGPARSVNPAPARPGRSSGLAGLAAEVTARGGEFDAAPLASGFAVVARYPVGGDTPSPSGL